MIKTLLIAPYQGLAETAKKMKVPDEIELDVTVANLEEGVRVAKLAEKQGYDLIVSRGGTASMIQDVVSIPVVYIEITGYDMLRVFTLIRGIKVGVALVGYANISQGAATICSILEFDVKMITIQSRNEVRGHLEKLKQQGYTVVIGDVITVQVAEQVGLRGVLITSGKEAISAALEEGKRVYYFFRRVNNQFYYFQETFNLMPFPTVLLRSDGEIMEKNLLFGQYKGSNEILTSGTIYNIMKQVLANEATQWAEIEGENCIYEIQAFLVNKSEAIIGINIHSSFEKTETKAVRIIGDSVYIPIIGESDQSQSLRENIQQYANSDGAVCIIGESGIGKYSVAKAMHFKRFGQDSPIIVIEGGYLTEEPFKQEVQSKISTIKFGTVLIKDIESVPHEIQKNLYSLLHNLPNTVKVIVLAEASLEKLVYERSFNKDLYNEISKYVLHLPPLRKRKEDIRDFVDYFLAQFHEEDGNETVGMKQDAVEYLKQFEWPGNLSQLRNVIRELSIMNPLNYIELSHVKELLDKYEQMSDIDDKRLPLDGTLKEIEQKIIKQVLHEEGNNQSNAAKRLDINRSTLWRKLKE
ncbi:PrpR N-terminal domain-containing protein [Virgibacillus siamensis]|uniref:PrpR N-terminal domain-containing protein n=1 Tax=Virgibacillus siamensis TaxID=480071 RepID=UPI001588D8B0|nr:sigma-54-dependent transcriptional regulator [Virgibacillus siamensis]